MKYLIRFHLFLSRLSKLLHLTPSYLPSTAYGGPTLSIAHLCETLVAAGHEVQVYCTKANGMAELEVPENMSINKVKVRYFKRITGDHSHLSPALLWALWRHCREYEVVHIHSWWNLVAMPAVLICWLRGIRPVLSTRGMLSAYTFQSTGKRLFHRWIGRYLLRQCLLHCTSEIEARQVRQVSPSCRYFQAPNMLSFPDVVSEHPAGRHLLEIIFIGRIHPVKGLPPLFQALSSVSFPWQLTIAGTGDTTYLTELKSLAQSLGIDPHIRWIGWVDGTEKYRLLAVSDLFVLTSYSENFANAALEALAMGTPVLLSEEVGLATYVQQTNAGRVCATEAESVRTALENLYQDIREGRFDRTAIARQTRTDFDPERIAQQYLGAYQTLS